MRPTTIGHVPRSPECRATVKRKDDSHRVDREESAVRRRMIDCRYVVRVAQLIRLVTHIHAAMEQRVHSLVRSNDHHHARHNHVVTRLTSCEKQELRRPKLRIVLKVSNRFGAHRAVLALFLKDRTTMLRHHDVHAPLFERHRSSLM
jgi:hypothetical protein